MQTLEKNILDVTVLEPKEKHSTIFMRFDELLPGESLTIHNDHDPKPLYYQLLGERGNNFLWQYLEEGPVQWKIRISKKNNEGISETLGEIAAKDLRKAAVFKKYGIDYCCNGKRTVKEACEAKGLNVSTLENELINAESAPESVRTLPYDEWDAGFLADYIVQTHHVYVKKTLPDIHACCEKVMNVHSGSHVELKRIFHLVLETESELLSHMKKEELVLFPYIKQLASNEDSTIASQLGSVQNPINMMEMEHELAGRNMEEIRTLTKNYTLPDDACGSYSLLYRLLQEFESDLHLHIHLENNLLFPKAVALEKSRLS